MYYGAASCTGTGRSPCRLTRTTSRPEWNQISRHPAIDAIASLSARLDGGRRARDVVRRGRLGSTARGNAIDATTTTGATARAPTSTQDAGLCRAVLRQTAAAAQGAEEATLGLIYRRSRRSATSSPRWRSSSPIMPLRTCRTPYACSQHPAQNTKKVARGDSLFDPLPLNVQHPWAPMLLDGPRSSRRGRMTSTTRAASVMSGSGSSRRRASSGSGASGRASRAASNFVEACAQRDARPVASSDEDNSRIAAGSDCRLGRPRRDSAARRARLCSTAACLITAASSIGTNNLRACYISDPQIRW